MVASDGEQTTRGEIGNGIAVRQWRVGEVGAGADTEELRGGAVLEGLSTGPGDSQRKLVLERCSRQTKTSCRHRARG
jgi:hypothetical protein